MSKTLTKMELVIGIRTLTASWKKRTVISIPKSSPAILVNLEMMLAAFNIARRISKTAVQTQTLFKKKKREYSFVICKYERAISKRIIINLLKSLIITILPKPSRVSDPVQACLC